MCKIKYLFYAASIMSFYAMFVTLIYTIQQNKNVWLGSLFMLLFLLISIVFCPAMYKNSKIFETARKERAKRAIKKKGKKK